MDLITPACSEILAANAVPKLRLVDQCESRRVRPMKVLVLGMCRTGTFSLYTALQKLGFRPYHMVDTLKRPDHMEMWAEAMRAKFFGEGKPWGREELDKLLGDFDCVLDVPGCLFVDELRAAYPDAKVILTERNAHNWLASMHATVFGVLDAPAARLLARVDREYQRPLHTMLALVFAGFCAGERGERARQAYFAHNAYVRTAVPARDLLVFAAPFAWAPLCRHLGVAVPAAGEAYPHANDSTSFVAAQKEAQRRALARVAAKLAAAAAPFAVVGAVIEANCLLGY